MQDSLIPDQTALDVAAHALGVAQRAGCTAAVSINAGNGLLVGVRGGEVETLEYHRDKSLAVTVYQGKRKGTATTTDFAPDAVAETVAAAVRIATDAEPDEYAGLIDPALLARRPEEGEWRAPGTTDHWGEFIRSVRTRRRTVSHAEAAHASFTIGAVALISMRLGCRPIRWDAAAERVIGDPEADALRERPWRKGWRIAP